VDDFTHYLYSRVKLGERALRRLLSRDNGTRLRANGELIFYVYAQSLEDALGLVADMRDVADTIRHAADDLEAFAEGFDFTAPPARG